MGDRKATAVLTLGLEPLEAAAGSVVYSGLLGGESPYVRGENEYQTPLKNRTIYSFAAHTFNISGPFNILKKY